MSETPADQPASAAWRTVFLTAFGMLLLSACFVWASRRSTLADISVAQAYGSLCLAITLSISAVAAKALGEHLGNGTGTGGAWAALTTSAKPGDPAVAPGAAKAP